MPDKKISDFEIFEAIPDQNTAFVASSGNPGLASATNVRFPFPLLSEEIVKYIGGGYRIISGDDSFAYFGAIDPLDSRDAKLYSQGENILTINPEKSTMFSDFIVDKNITSSGEFHSESGYFGPSFIGATGIFNKAGIGTLTPGVVDSNPANFQIKGNNPSISIDNTSRSNADFIIFNSEHQGGYGFQRKGILSPDLYISFDGEVGIGTNLPSAQLHITGGDETLACTHGRFGETLTVSGNPVITGLNEVYAEIDLASGMSMARDATLQHELIGLSDEIYLTGQLLLGQKPSLNVVDGSVSNNFTVGNSLTIGGQRALTTADLPPIASATAPGLVKVNGGGLTIAADGLISIDTVSAPSFWTSDSRLKENLKSIKNPLHTVLGMKGVNFTWKDNGYNSLSNTEDIGLIAQELERVMPIAVSEQNDGMMGIHYHRLFPVLIEAIKELSNKVTNLEEEIKKLK